eukprot:g174.t1
MCKLVPDITEIQPFLPTLIPLVQKSEALPLGASQRCKRLTRQIDENLSAKLLSLICCKRRFPLTSLHLLVKR